VGPWALGVALRDSLDRTRRLAARAGRARVEGALAARRGAATERARISAELHDALAHALGAMVVRTAVARDLAGRDAAAAAATLRDIAQAGRDALGETGRLLRLLRDDRDELGLRSPVPVAEAEPPAKPTGPVAAVRIRRTDVLLPAFFAVVATAEIALEGYEPLWGSIAAYWLAAATLAARRALPLAMPVAVTGILLVGGLLGAETSEPAAGILVLALACSAPGLHASTSRAWLGLASLVPAAALASPGCRSASSSRPTGSSRRG
jgi:hypothetical protein